MMPDWFADKNITPMLIAQNQQPFDSPDYLFELKWDGIRCLAYLSESATELRNKRNKSLNAIYPELNAMHKQVKRRCILDGELTVLINGKPNFQEVQRRSLMGNPFKINLAAAAHPVCFIAYDVLYIGSEPVTQQPLTWRVDAMWDVVSESAALCLSRTFEQDGIALFEAAKAQGLEGIVAKRKESQYFPGKRTKDWVKIKNLLDGDFIVCGYYADGGSVASVVIGGYAGGQIIYQGHVALGVSRHDYTLMQQCERADPYAHYRGFPDLHAVWLLPKLVCTVQYMERTPTGGLRQPVFKGIRADKSPEECTV